MKNGRCILLMLCGFSLVLLLGIFIGRNLTHHYVLLPETTDQALTVGETASKDYRLDINVATKTQLMELPGIGEVTAQRILDYRTQNGMFSSIEDLMDVEGIGEKKLLQIEAYIKVGG